MENLRPCSWRLVESWSPSALTSSQAFQLDTCMVHDLCCEVSWKDGELRIIIHYVVLFHCKINMVALNFLERWHLNSLKSWTRLAFKKERKIWGLKKKGSGCWILWRHIQCYESSRPRSRSLWWWKVDIGLTFRWIVARGNCWSEMASLPTSTLVSLMGSLLPELGSNKVEFQAIFWRLTSKMVRGMICFFTPASTLGWCVRFCTTKLRPSLVAPIAGLVQSYDTIPRRMLRDQFEVGVEQNLVFLTFQRRRRTKSLRTTSCCGVFSFLW